jgi:hypothetical protein
VVAGSATASRSTAAAGAGVFGLGVFPPTGGTLVIASQPFPVSVGECVALSEPQAACMGASRKVAGVPATSSGSYPASSHMGCCLCSSCIVEFIAVADYPVHDVWLMHQALLKQQPHTDRHVLLHLAALQPAASTPTCGRAQHHPA